MPSWRAIAEIVLDGAGHVLDGDDDIGDAVLLEQVQDVLHHRRPTMGTIGLGRDDGERAQPRSLAACHDDSFHLPFLLSLGVR